jgi:hypothetical protein
MGTGKKKGAKRGGPSQDTVEKRIADLIGGGGAASSGAARILTKAKKEKRPEEIAAGNLRRKGALEVVDNRGHTEIVAPEVKPVEDPDAPKDTGLTLLREAVRDQSHLRKLPHHARHDYEFLLRRVATSGIVRLFNALSQAKAAGQEQFERAEKVTTVDKAEERKFVASRDAFLSALRTSQPTGHRI